MRGWLHVSVDWAGVGMGAFCLHVGAYVVGEEKRVGENDLCECRGWGWTRGFGWDFAMVCYLFAWYFVHREFDARVFVRC